MIWIWPSLPHGPPIDAKLYVWSKSILTSLVSPFYSCSIYSRNRLIYWLWLWFFLEIIRYKKFTLLGFFIRFDSRLYSSFGLKAYKIVCQICFAQCSVICVCKAREVFTNRAMSAPLLQVYPAINTIKTGEFECFKHWTMLNQL